MRALASFAALSLAACASTPEPQLTARIAPDVTLALPAPPNYPETRALTQIIRARRDGETRAFEAALTLSPAEVVIVIAAVAGPRLATITWTGEGVSQDRAALAPDAVPVENVLADIFVGMWPAEAVRASLPDGVELSEETGVRILSRGDEQLILVVTDPANPHVTTLTNVALGYELTIRSRSDE